ncbi:hypothetical protein KDW36_28050 [Burkholderia dolosa]|uniref:hypothetical protein n=1 Tax=Burkholderia dolosa TaxID=152500 RepID=UPI001B9AA964|nr:hypothetical protein [Burkholderia dolosa]MBR8317030.1 hypothetical protein [Burkholderia dolosa]
MRSAILSKVVHVATSLFNFPYKSMINHLIRAKFFNSTTSAVKLAEKNYSKHIDFAKQLLTSKVTSCKYELLSELHPTRRTGLLSKEDKYELLSDRLMAAAGKNIKVNLNPERAGATGYTKGFSIEPTYDRKGRIISHRTMGYTNNYCGTGDPALIVHGSYENALGFYDGIKPISDEKRNNFHTFNRMSEFVDFVQKKGVNLFEVEKGKKIHLLACYGGGSEGLAQHLANYLDREVVGYGDRERLYTYGIVEALKSRDPLTFVEKQRPGEGRQGKLQAARAKSHISDENLSFIERNNQ